MSHSVKQAKLKVVLDRFQTDVVRLCFAREMERELLRTERIQTEDQQTVRLPFPPPVHAQFFPS